MEVNKNQQIYENLLKQVFQVWVNNEISRRKREEDMSLDFQLRSAQIIFPLGGPPIIRLNNEVKARIKAKINKGVKKGDFLYERDIDDIQKIKLVEEEKDFAHITIVLFKGSWVISFSFIYDCSKSLKLIELGDKYLKSAKMNFKLKNFRPMIECLSIAAENYAKARIYLLPDEGIRTSNKHGYTQTKVNIYTRSNFFKSEFKDVFNKLFLVRDSARYNPDIFNEKENFKKMIASIEDARSEVVGWIRKV